MNRQQIALTRLLGKKEWKPGLIILDESKREMVLVGQKYFENDHDVYLYTPSLKEIHHWFDNEEHTRNKKDWENIGHPATLSDLHRWMTDRFHWTQDSLEIQYGGDDFKRLEYDSRKDLLDQSPETLARIIELITNNQ